MYIYVYKIDLYGYTTSGKQVSNYITAEFENGWMTEQVQQTSFWSDVVLYKMTSLISNDKREILSKTKNSENAKVLKI